MPNPNTIPWLHYQDIQIPDVAVRTEFENNILGGNFAEALQILRNNQNQLLGKSFIANTINVISSGILYLESKFNDNVLIFLSDLAAQYQNLINNFRRRGIWSATESYVPYNFVVYNDEIYLCIADSPVGTLPTDETYWLYLGLLGPKGAVGVDVNMQFDWNGATTYQPNDLVVYDNTLYVALKENINVIPGTDPTTWNIFLTSVDGYIVVGTTAPSAYVNNTVWFQTESDPLTATDVDTPILGQFFRWNENQAYWEPMYPNTFFSLVEYNTDTDAPPVKILDVNIETTEWVSASGQWTYSIDMSAYGIDLNTLWVLDILPGENITEAQYDIYNYITLSQLNNVITITYTESTRPTVALPIIIRAQ